MIKTPLYDRKRENDNDLSIWEHIFDLAVKKANFNFSKENIMLFFYGYFTEDVIWEHFFKEDAFLFGKVYDVDLLFKDLAFIKLEKNLINMDTYTLFVIHYSYEKIRGLLANPKKSYFDKFQIDSITKYFSEKPLNFDDIKTIQKENGVECLIYNKKNEKIMFIYHEETGTIINLK